ncbi:AAA domain-containing protein [Chytridium lagenaria]|nr:AAA domain-containing protein [Chytridium lagenaria]
MDAPERAQPNILITGTPGTGKTTTAQMVAQLTGLEHIEVGKIVKERNLHSGMDDEFNAYIIDEDKVIDELEETMAQGGKIVDHHGCDFFPERWFDLVVVLRCSNDVLYPRLEKRGYSENKITENIECEIMEVVAQEARDSYEAEILVELVSETIENIEENVNRIETWVENYRDQHQSLGR